MTAIAEADVKERVFTKEELDELRRRLSELRDRDANVPSGEALSGKPYGWEHDLDGLAIFLQDIKEVIGFVVKERILEAQRPGFVEYLPEIEVRLDIAIATLKTIDNNDNELYIKLHNAGLTENRLKVKLREYWRRIKGSPIVAVLKMADTILGSLFPIIAELEPVKEFKETLESKLENDGDPGLQSLNISGREQWWKHVGEQP